LWSKLTVCISSRLLSSSLPPHYSTPTACARACGMGMTRPCSSLQDHVPF
jgi:hypothetical protein